MLAKVMEQSLVLARTAETAAKSLELTTSQFDQKTGHALAQINRMAADLPKNMTLAMERHLQDAAHKAAEVMVTKWEQANQAASQAAHAFQQAAKDAQETSRRAVAAARRDWVTIFMIGFVAGAVTSVGLASWIFMLH